MMAMALYAASSMADEAPDAVTPSSPTSQAPGRSTPSTCPDTVAPSAGQLLSSPATLEAVRCLIERDQTALAILMLQQLLAADESNKDAALLLDEQLSKSAQPQPVSAPATSRSESTAITGWLAAELGHDSNINRATSAKVIDIPLLNYRSLSLPDLLVEQASSFAGLNGDVTIRMPITSTLRASLHGQASLRANFSEVAYLPHNYLVAAHLEQDVGDTTVALGGSLAQQWVAKFRLLERSAARVQVSTQPSKTVALALSVEWASNTYPLFDNLGTRENIVELRGTYRPFNLQFGAYWGEEASRSTIKDLDRTFDGLSIGWRYPITDNWRLAIDASAGQSRYGQFSRLFATQRSDRQTDLSFALQVRLTDGWSVTPKLMMERNNSSMALNQYRRTQYLAELRKDF